MAMSIRILSMAGFFALFELIDQGVFGGSVLATLFNGDFEEAFKALKRNSAEIIFNKEQRTKLFRVVGTTAGLQFVSDQLGFKKSFTFAGITIGI